ncbi:MAG: DnaB-like helicase C-terminal domain-containing protein [Planctomycetaceae bacterium]|nr:DnaB-like helicase C-terminal domain-containing protein [Planctomycetaceae bacterium]
MQSDIRRGTDWQDADAQHQARVNDLMESSANTGIKTFSDTRETLLRDLNGLNPPGLQTGFRDVDAAIGYLRPGNMILVCGSTGLGKSAFALNIAIQNAKLKNRVCIVSVEMKTNEIHERAVAIHTGICPTGVISKTIGETEKREWSRAINEVCELPIMVIDEVTGLETIVYRLRNAHRRSKIDLVIVDYAQMISAEGSNREQEVARVARTFKVLAVSMGIPIILLAQTNRDAEKRKDTKPQLSDIRDSAALAQDANMVLMLYRHEIHHPNERRGEIDVYIRKGRSVGRGIVTLNFHDASTTFTDMEPSYDHVSVPSDSRKK